MAFSVLSILNQYWNIVYARPGLEYYYRREPLSMYWEFQVIKSLWVKLLLWGGLCCHNLPNDCVKINECKWACIRPSLPEISLEAVFLWALAVLCHAICIIVRKQGRIFLQQLCCFHKLCVKCASLAGIHTVQNILNQALLLSVPNWAMQKSSLSMQRLSYPFGTSAASSKLHPTWGSTRTWLWGSMDSRERAVMQLFAHPLNVTLPSLFSRGWVCALLNPTRAYGDMGFAQRIRQGLNARISSTEILSCSRCPLQMSEMWVKLY